MVREKIALFSCMDWRVWAAMAAYLEKKYNAVIYLITAAGSVRDLISCPDLSKDRSIAEAYAAGVRTFAVAMHGGRCAGYKDLEAGWKSPEEARTYLEAEAHAFALRLKETYDHITVEEYFVEIAPDNVTVQDIVLAK